MSLCPTKNDEKGEEKRREEEPWAYRREGGEERDGDVARKKNKGKRRIMIFFSYMNRVDGNPTLDSPQDLK